MSVGRNLISTLTVHESDPEANCDYAEPARTKIGLVKASFLKYVVLIY